MIHDKHSLTKIRSHHWLLKKPSKKNIKKYIFFNKISLEDAKYNKSIDDWKITTLPSLFYALESSCCIKDFYGYSIHDNNSSCCIKN